jgi:tRNA pseudouridine32 synthase / 23S rRNA pseudouridine746 synthase
VHAAHVSGLNHPILGDDIYGRRDSRLFLHAEFIEFRHPISGKWMKFDVESGF